MYVLTVHDAAIAYLVESLFIAAVPTMSAILSNKSVIFKIFYTKSYITNVRFCLLSCIQIYQTFIWLLMLTKDIPTFSIHYVRFKNILRSREIRE